MNLEKAYAGTEIEQEGRWFKAYDVFKSSGIVDEDDPAEIKLASSGAGNLRYQWGMMREASKRGLVKKKEIHDFEALVKAAQSVVAETVILDWKGFTDVDGKEIPYSPKYMLSVFEKYPRVFLDIQDFVSEDSKFRAEVLEETIKN